MTKPLYDTDFAAWAESQADALRHRSANEIDWDNVAEEIESLSRSDKREIWSRLRIICIHLLKWAFESNWRSTSSWQASIDEGRLQIARLIKESPSLASYPTTQLADAYAHARQTATSQARIPDLPDTCLWTIEQVLDPDFWPPEPRT